jgi:hypothetical protein
MTESEELSVSPPIWKLTDTMETTEICHLSHRGTTEQITSPERILRPANPTPFHTDWFRLSLICNSTVGSLLDCHLALLTTELGKLQLAMGTR